MSIDDDLSFRAGEVDYSTSLALFILLCPAYSLALLLLVPNGSSPITNVGINTFSNVPNPNYPFKFNPQEYTSPFAVNINECSAPQAIREIL